MASFESVISKAFMATDPAERQWYEDQATIMLHSGRNLTGNSQTAVIDGATASQFIPAERVDRLTADMLAELTSRGFRVIDGRKLFTPRDNPRPFKA